MTKQEILAFLNEHPLCFLATAVENTPHVRGMLLFRADDDGILFHTGQGKELTEQLEKNPVVELCALNTQRNVQVRVSGTVEFLDDLALKQSLVAQRPFLQPIVDASGYAAFLVFRVTHAVATVWTMEENMAPKSYVSLTAE